MICETCHGEGWIWFDHIEGVGILTRDPILAPRTPKTRRMPCPDCGGCGRAHCCEGDREQPVTRWAWEWGQHGIGLEVDVD